MNALRQRRRALMTLLAGAGALASGGVRAQDAGDYPNRAVRMIIPYLAGGGADIAARIVAQGLAKAWKQPVVAENFPGAGSNVGL